jgi:hypothetical protein
MQSLRISNLCGIFFGLDIRASKGWCGVPADEIWALSVKVEPQKLRRALAILELSQHEFADMLGHGKRTGQYWANKSVPASVMTMAALLVERPELVDAVKRIAKRLKEEEAKAAKKRKRSSP